jgi:hypothetical protein
MDHVEGEGECLFELARDRDLKGIAQASPQPLCVGGQQSRVGEDQEPRLLPDHRPG